MKKINLSRKHRKVSVFSQKVKAQAGRDVSIYGGPGSGRYPRGSGDNPQAEKRNPSKREPSNRMLLDDFNNTSDPKEQRNILRKALQNDIKKNQGFIDRETRYAEEISDAYDKISKAKTTEEKFDMLNKMKEEAYNNDQIVLGNSMLVPPVDSKLKVGGEAYKRELEKNVEDTLYRMQYETDMYIESVNSHQKSIDQNPLNTGKKIDPKDFDRPETSEIKEMAEKTNGEY